MTLTIIGDKTPLNYGLHEIVFAKGSREFIIGSIEPY
jgi:hypothetical protein